MIDCNFDKEFKDEELPNYCEIKTDNVLKNNISSISLHVELDDIEQYQTDSSNYEFKKNKIFNINDKIIFDSHCNKII